MLATFGLDFPETARADITSPRLLYLTVRNGDTAFAGDRDLLTTLSPNGDGFRERAVVRFYLTERARVTLQVLVTRSPGRLPSLLWATSAHFTPGWRKLAWDPVSTRAPRTYLLRLVAVDDSGNRRIYGKLRPSDSSTPPGPVARIQGVDTGFTRRSYLSGGTAYLRVATDAHRLTLELFQAGPELAPSASEYRTDELHGVPVSAPVELDWSGNGSIPVVMPIRLATLPSGFFFARLSADDGRLGFAPFIVRPSSIGRHRVAVVLPTNTWQAYNRQDVDGDGWGDTWYAASNVPSVDLRRPYLNRGVPPRFRPYHLGFLRWLYRTGREVDFLSDDTLNAVASGDLLAARYDLIVFAGHEEYVTGHVYDIVTRYRNLGGNLMFLSANNFFWRIVRLRHRIYRDRTWRSLGRPEARLIGVQYLSNDGGRHQGRYVVVGAERVAWVFADTGLQNGDLFGHGGIEIDARTRASPTGTRLLAVMANVHGPGKSAEMTFYKTVVGAKVFAAGTLNFGGTVLNPTVSPVLQNVWERLSRA